MPEMHLTLEIHFQQESFAPQPHPFLALGCVPLRLCPFAVEPTNHKPFADLCHTSPMAVNIHNMAEHKARQEQRKSAEVDRFGYRHALFPCQAPTCWSVGARCHVWVKSAEKNKGRGEIVNADGDGRWLVRHEHDNQVRSVNSKRLVRVFGGGQEETPILLICGDTDSYRRLAWTQLRKDDTTIEIGSSAGRCTAIIGKMCASVLG